MLSKMNKKSKDVLSLDILSAYILEMIEIIFITIGIGMTVALNAKLKLLLYFTEPKNYNEVYGDL